MESVSHLLMGTPARLLVTIGVGLLLVHVAYFLILPNAIAGKTTRNPRIRRFLQAVVATPSLLGGQFKIAARQHLMRLALMEGLYAEVAAQGFEILKHAAPLPGLAAEVRGRLADALEALGRRAEAQDQRRLAQLDLAKAPRDPAWYINRGRQLTALRDYLGACRAYEDGLDAAPPGRNEARALLTLALGNSLHMAGRMEESARRAEEATELVTSDEQKIMAHRQAAASYATLGRLDESEAHRLRAVELARSFGDRATLVNTLAELAAIQRKRGRLAESLAACDRAEAEAGTTRQLELLRYETLRSWGRFDEALAALDRVVATDPLPIPEGERLMQGMFSFSRGQMFMELGRLDEVPSLLADARGGVRGNTKLELWCDAASLRLAALQGRRDLVQDGYGRLEQRLDAFADDRNTRTVVLGCLGRAALALGENDRALEFWRRYLDCGPDAVEVPLPLYQIGEAHRALGHVEAARAAYRDAVGTGLDTRYTQLAQERLRTLF